MWGSRVENVAIKTGSKKRLMFAAPPHVLLLGTTQSHQ